MAAGVPQGTIDHFKALTLARSTLNDPDFRIVLQSRSVTDGGVGHTLTGRTWNTESTIQHLLTLARSSSSPSPLTFPQQPDVRPELHRFYTFGSDLNAHPHLLHGGVISCILDSSLGGVIGLALRHQAGGPPIFTVQLNVTYKTPVRTPGTVMVRSWVTKVEDGGRKAWARGRVEGEGGVVHAEAEGMWLRPRTSGAKM